MLVDVLVATRNEIAAQGLVVLVLDVLKSCGDHLGDLVLGSVGDSFYQGARD